MYRKGDLRSAIIRAPLVRIVVPFIAGLAVARYVLLPLPVAWAMCGTTVAMWCVLAYLGPAYAWRWASGVSLIAALFTFGLLWQRLHSQEQRADHVGLLSMRADGWNAGVLEIASANERVVRAWMEVHAAVVGDSIVPASGRLLVTLMRDSARRDPAVGDRLLINGVAEPIIKTPDPGGFDLLGWAASHGAAYECFAPADHWKVVRSGGGWTRLFEGSREKIAQWLRDSGLPDRERALVKAVLLGLRDELGPDQNAAFVRSGTIHVLAVSGSHVAIIYAAVVIALSTLGRRKRGHIVRGLVVLGALWLYAGLTGFTPSVLRATVMFSLFTIAEMVGWRVDPLNSLAAAAFLLLLWDPSMLVQLGLQLSFLAVLGILVYYRSIARLWTAPNKALHFFWSLFAVSLAAQAFTLPLCLALFHAFPVWFLPANMVVVGLVTVAVYGGIALVAFHAVPVLGAFLSVLMKWLLMLLGGSSAFFAELPGAYPAVRIGHWGMVGLYALLAVFTIWTLQHRRWARSATFALGAILLCSWAWTAHQRNGQRQLAIYNDRDALACAIVQGRTMRVFADSATGWTERKVRDHARSAGVDRIIRIDSVPQRLKWGGQAFVFASLERSSSIPEAIDSASTVVLHGPGWLDRDALEHCGADTSTAWVLASDLSGHARRNVVEWCEAAHRPHYDMREAGAYVRP